MMPTANKEKRMVTVAIRRENWIHHAIQCEERKALLKEIDAYLSRTSTRELIVLLGEIAHQSEDGMHDDAITEIEYDPSDPSGRPPEEWEGVRVIEGGEPKQ